MIDLEFLGQIKRFDLVIKKRVVSQYSGERQSQGTGDGLVFKDYKDYVPGDDFRSIDWRVYARTNKFFIRQYEEERNMTMHVIVDTSGSMNFGSPTTKFEYASMLGLGLCYIAWRNNEKYEFSTFSEQFQALRPKKGKNQLVAIVDTLNKIKPDGKSRFRESLDSFKKRLKSKSMIVVVSDFLFEPEELYKALYIFRRSDLKIIQVLDRSEVRLNLDGENILKDSETGGLLRTFISNRLKQRYQKYIEDHSAKLKSICDSIGAEYTLVNTGMPVFDSFYQILKK